MEQFILVREYEFTSPLITVYSSVEQAKEYFTHDFGGVKRITLYRSTVDSLGSNLPTELMSRECVMDTAH